MVRAISENQPSNEWRFYMNRLTMASRLWSKGALTLLALAVGATALAVEVNASPLPRDEAVYGYTEIGTTDYADAGMNRIASLNLVPEGFFRTGIIDSNARYAYFATALTPAKIVKIDLSSRTRVDMLVLREEESVIEASGYDPLENMGYFASSSTQSKIIKVNLNDFTREAVLSLDSELPAIKCVAIDSKNRRGFFGLASSPGQVVVVDLTTFTVETTITLYETEDVPSTAYIDPTRDYIYFSTFTYPCKVIRFNKITLERVDSLQFLADEDACTVVVGDSAGNYAYYGTSYPGKLVKVDLNTFTRVAAVQMHYEAAPTISGVISPDEACGYFAFYDYPASIAKVNLDTMVVTERLICSEDVYALGPALLDAARNVMYLGPDTIPAAIVSIDLESFTQKASIPCLDGLSNVRTMLVDQARRQAYLGTRTNPPRIGLVNMDSFELESVLSFWGNTGEILCGAMDHAAAYAYFVLNSYPMTILKLDTATFTIAAEAQLTEGLWDAYVMLIDPTDTYAYLATHTVPIRIIKVDLQTFQQAATLDLNEGEDDVQTGFMDPAGANAYFCSGGAAGTVVKLDLETFTRSEAVTLATDKAYIMASTVERDGQKAYLGTWTSPATLTCLDLSSFTEGETLTLGYAEENCHSTLLDEARNLAYVSFGAYPPGQIAKLDLTSFTEVGVLSLAPPETELFAAALDPLGEFALYGTATDPGYLVKVGLASQRGVVQGTAAAVSEPVSCTAVNFYAHEAGKVRLAVYEYNENLDQLYLQWQSPELNNQVADSWLAVPISAGSPQSLQLDPGRYFVCWQTDSSHSVGSYTQGSDGDGIQWGQEYGEFEPKPRSHSLTDELWSIYLDCSSTEPTPTPSLSCDLSLNSRFFSPGDVFSLRYVITQTGAALPDASVLVALEVYGELWFYPSWLHYTAPDYELDSLPVRLRDGYNVFFILDFVWPDTGPDQLENLLFHGAIMDETLTELACYNSVTFGYGPFGL